MAQAETSEPVSTISEPPSSPAKSQSVSENLPQAGTQSDTIETETEIVGTTSVLDNVIPFPPKISDTQDDDVQFVFSVPRRRKKKRKRVGSSPKESDLDQTTLEGASNLPLSPRRASTSMVQKPEDFQTGEAPPQTLTKTGSLPTIMPPDENGSLSCYASFNPSEPSHVAIPTPTFRPFPGWHPWWSNPASPILSRCDAQHNWVPIPIGAGYKRKWHGDHEGSMASPIGDPGPLHSPCFSDMLSETSDIDAIGEPDPLVTSLWEDETMQTPPSISSGPKSTAFTGGYPNTDARNLSPQTPTSNGSKGTGHNQMWTEQREPSRSMPNRSATQLQPYHSSNWQKAQLPASLVPDESVSPKTKTVAVLKQPNGVSLPVPPQSIRPVPASSRYESAAAIGTNQNGQFSNRASPGPQVEQWQNVTPPSTPHRSAIPRPQPQTNPYDILRKPSLYKIPPWPSLTFLPAASPNDSPPRSAASHIEPPSNSSKPPSRGIQGSTAVKQPTPTSSPVHTVSRSPRDQDRMLATPPQQSSPQPSQPPLTSESVSSHGPRSHRKFPPNLQVFHPHANSSLIFGSLSIVDIAQTSQDNFPFAAVAERHKVPIQKVFDTFSAIIQLPLLRNSIDNRLNGPLARQRMKEFKDAKHAMEKAKEGRSKIISKDLSRNESTADNAERPSKKRKRGPLLLKAAVLNNAKEREGTT